MVVEVRPDVIDGHQLKWMMAAGVSWLGANKNQVNNMNVFPVPDGDTGTNMHLTISNAYKQVANLEESHVGIVSEKLARGALTGARGNSGTILSMLLRGFAQALKGKAVMDASAFALACQRAVEYAYETVSSVMEPVEGTILTVAREAAQALQERVQHETDLKVLLNELIHAAHQSLANTPNLLPMLKEAGVVDSGGMGLVYILEGIKRISEGQPVALEHDDHLELQTAQSPAWQQALVPDDEEGYGYDVQFLMLGKNLDVDKVRRDISAMGWSPLIDGDEELIKVHIHVHNPGEPLTYAIQQGVDLDDIVVENMQAQYLQYVRDRESREEAEKEIHGVAVITVGRGAGLTKLFREYGAARVIEGGQTMNPSTDDFLEAIHALNTDEIIILPNNGNIIMAARQAADHVEGKTIRVVPSKSAQQGITALLSYLDLKDDGSLDEIYETMCEDLKHVISADITIANRTVTIDDVAVQEGQHIGMINNKLVTAGDDLWTTVRNVLDAAHANQYELATFYYGDSVTEEAAIALTDALEGQYGALTFEIVNGGQPLYPYLISIE